MRVASVGVFVVVAVLAGAVAAPWSASGGRGGGVAPSVPAATRFCERGGDPAKPGKGRDARGVGSSKNPLAGLDFYVPKIQEDAYADLRGFQRRGQKAKAAYMAKVALTPRATWFGKFTSPNFEEKVRNHINCAQALQPGSVPIMAVLRGQSKECNAGYQGGGEAEDRATKAWYRSFAGAVGDARVVIAFEPDSIGTISCLAKGRRRARLKVLRYGVDVMSKLKNATVYVEGTASDWKSASYTAKTLRYLGVSKVRGFMLNVTHFDWTTNNIRYGRRVSRKLGGKPFVVSTSYNGRGAVHYKAKGGRTINVFCNVRYRGAGPAPDTSTGYAGVDAFLWLNRPGVSGAGACNGAPSNGQWWTERALMYGKYATNQLGPKKGTRFGFRRRISLCALGAPGPDGRYYTSAPERRCR